MLLLVLLTTLASAQFNTLDAQVGQACIEPALAPVEFGAGGTGSGLADAEVYNVNPTAPLIVISTNGAYYGNGNTDARFVRSVVSVPRGAGTVNVEIGLRVEMRNQAGAPNAVQEGSLVRIPSGKGLKIDYSIRVLPAVLGAPVPATDNYWLLDLITSGGGRFELGIDTDLTDATDFSAFDPLSFAQRTPTDDGAFQIDHAFLRYPFSGPGIAALTDYERQIGTAGTFVALLGQSTGAQNSVQPQFLDTFAPKIDAALMAGFVDAAVTSAQKTAFRDGRYEVYLLFSRNGVSLARTSLSVLQGLGGTGTTITPAFASPAQLFGTCRVGSE